MFASFFSASLRHGVRRGEFPEIRASPRGMIVRNSATRVQSEMERQYTFSLSLLLSLSLILAPARNLQITKFKLYFRSGRNYSTSSSSSSCVGGSRIAAMDLSVPEDCVESSPVPDGGEPLRIVKLML